jgi:hypothetical protein
VQNQIGFAESGKLLTAFSADEEISGLVSLSFRLAGLFYSRIFVLIAPGTDDTIAISVLNDGRISFPLGPVIQAPRTGMQQFVNQGIPDCPFTALQMIYRYTDDKFVSFSSIYPVLLTLSVPAGGLGKTNLRADFPADRNPDVR